MIEWSSAERMTGVVALLLATAIPLCFVVAVVVQYAWLNYKARICDACRVEQQQRAARGTNRGARSAVILAHACSPKRWPYKKPERGVA